MNKGFTLIELLVVVLIIGILAAVALPQYMKAVERARSAEAIQRLGDLATAIQIWYMQHTAFPAATDVPNMDISFGTGTGNNLNTTNYTVTMHGGGLVSARRNGGNYSGATLVLRVNANGTIDKECHEGTTTNGNFCELVSGAGYASGSAITIPTT